MKPRTANNWEPEHRASIRHRVAVEAARMLYHREVKEYFHAKREAARRQGTRHLPSNREVHEQLLQIARKVDGDEHSRRLTDMRRTAVTVMELLEPFNPRLIGSVLTGHIRKGSDIDLHVYSDDLEGICRALEAGGHECVVESVETRKYGDVREFVHVRLPDAGGFEVEITLYPVDDLYVQPRCGITGGPMKRASLAEVRQLLHESQAVPQTAISLASPIDREAVTRLIPELLACGGVLQNHFHHLDVLEHTWAVVAGLERLVAGGYERFGANAPHLRRHMESQGRQTLLYLAGICHDLGKPATQSFGRDGRIRFIGHDYLGAEMVRKIGPRIGLDPSFTEALARITACHLEAVLIPAQGGEASRIHRLFSTVEAHLPELAMLSLCDAEAACGPAQTAHGLEEQEQFVSFLLDQYFEGGFIANPVLPVSGDDLREQFGILDPRTQSRLEDGLMAAFLDGEFEDREEGLALAAEFLADPNRRS